jgi:hypothetical protein
MDGHGWVDIAYTSGYCNHGYVLAGRGYGVRTAANGTNDSNQNYYAFVWVGGGSAKPNQTALNALEWLIGDARKHGDAGNKVKPHSLFHSTACPGDTIRNYIKQFDGKAVDVTPNVTGGKYLTEDGILDAGTIKVIQKFLGVKVLTGELDGATCVALQKWCGAVQDGVIGPNTVGKMQEKLGMKNITHSWSTHGVGDPTTRAFEQYLNRGIRAGTFKP